MRHTSRSINEADYERVTGEHLMAILSNEAEVRPSGAGWSTFHFTVRPGGHHPRA